MLTSPNKTVVVLAGPTASGKTALAIELARMLGTEIISADSRQCFRELNIGVARPSPEELQAVPHHFIATHSIHEPVTAATFEQYALDKATQLFRDKDTVVMAGGTGLYIRAFCEGLDDIPEVPEGAREALVQEYEEKGLAWLQEAVARLDPEFFAQADIQNPQRLLRALEVVQATGRSILTFRSGSAKGRPFRVMKICIELPRALLYQRINDRVERMMQSGLLDEVRSLLPYRHLNALQTVGYKELFDHFAGQSTLPEAVAAIQQHTRHYAKRQLTWFRRAPGYHFLSPEAVLAFVQQELRS